MPIFVYRCPSCDLQFEKIVRQPSQEEPCPSCGAMAEKQIAVPFAAPSSTCQSSGGGCGSGGFR